MKKIIACSAIALSLAVRAVDTSDYIEVLDLDFETESTISASITGGYVPDDTISITETISNQPTYSQGTWTDTLDTTPGGHTEGEHFLLMSRPVNKQKYGAYIDFAACAATADASLSGNYILEYDCNLGGGYNGNSYMVIEGANDAMFYISIPGKQSSTWGETATMYDSAGTGLGGISVRSQGQEVGTTANNLWYHVKVEGLVGDGVYVTITRPKTSETPLARTKVADFQALSQLRFVLNNQKNSNSTWYYMYTAIDNLVLKALPGRTLAEESIAETSDGYAAVSIPSEKTPGETTTTTLDESKTWGGIVGVGRVASEYDQTIYTGGDGSFVGAFTGAMKLTLTGTGTYSVLGESSNTGGFDVQGGTLKFALPTSLSGITYNLDASKTDTITEEDGKTKWSDALGGSYYAIATAYSDNASYSRESVNATVTTNYFGGRPSLHSEKFRMLQNYDGEYQSSVFAVFTLAANGRIMEDNGDAYYGFRWYVSRDSSNGGAFKNGSNSNDPANYGSYMGVNGTIGGTANVGVATVVSIPFHWTRYGSNGNYGKRKVAYGRGNEMAWAEIISMNRPVTLEEQMAVDAFLKGKWGIAAYQPLGTGTVTVRANGTLDANNVHATIASLNLAGTLANATNLTVTDAATFSAGATIEVALSGDASVGTKILSCASASGLENLTVKVNGVALTGLKPKFKTDGIYLGRVGFVISIASADVTIDENDSFNSWLSSNGYDISTESGITAVQTALVTKSETTGMSPLEAYVLGYDDKGATPNIAATPTATGFTLTFDSHTPNALSGIGVTYSVKKSSDNSVWSDATTTSAGSGAVSLAFDDAGLYNKLVATIAAAGE